MRFIFAIYFPVLISFAELLFHRIDVAYFSRQRKQIKNKFFFLWGGFSRCPHCDTRLNALDLLPVLGFIIRLGRCRHCQKPIDKIHLLGESIFLVYGIFYFIFNDDVAKSILTCVFVVLVYIVMRLDFKFFIIPHEWLLPLLITSVVDIYFRVPVHSIFFAGTPIDEKTLILFSAFCWLLILYVLYKVMPGKLGFADIPLTFALILALDFPLGLFLPSLTAAVVLLFYTAQKIWSRGVPVKKTYRQNFSTTTGEEPPATSAIDSKKRIALGAYLGAVFLILRIF